LGTTQPIALYDLKTDLGETNNVAAQYPDLVRKVEKILKTARTDNVHWKINERGIPGASPLVEDRK
jgi:hypothetical protein